MRDGHVLHYNSFLKENIRKQLKQLGCVLKKKPFNELHNSTKKLLIDQTMISELQISIYYKHNVTDVSKSEILILQRDI